MVQDGITNQDEENKRRSKQTPRDEASLALSPVWEDWSGRGCGPLVDFPSDEPLPLEFEETLGIGSSGAVEKIVCHKISLAVKMKHVRQGKPREWEEIDVLKNLSHRHIIKYVGSFNHQQKMGLVLWPVAVCDLATFFRDMDVFKTNQTLRNFSKTNPEPIQHFKELGIKVDSCALARPLAREWLYQKFGCLASAIYYIHRKGIRHKDLKPSNILLTPSGLRITDFGTSTDFSDRPSSKSNNGERGTWIYFAPEVAADEENGRSADIFMLGCVFLEMCWSACMEERTMEDLIKARPNGDKSFQANLSTVRALCLSCIDEATKDPHVTAVQHILLLTRQMLDPDPTKRPDAFKINSELVLFDGCRKKDNEKGESEWSFHGRCCQPVQIGTKPITKAGINDLKQFMHERGQPVALLPMPNDPLGNGPSHPPNVITQNSSTPVPQLQQGPSPDRQSEDSSCDAGSLTSASEEAPKTTQRSKEMDFDEGRSQTNLGNIRPLVEPQRREEIQPSMPNETTGFKVNLDSRQTRPSSSAGYPFMLPSPTQSPLPNPEVVHNVSTIPLQSAPGEPEGPGFSGSVHSLERQSHQAALPVALPERSISHAYPQDSLCVQADSLRSTHSRHETPQAVHPGQGQAAAASQPEKTEPVSSRDADKYVTNKSRTPLASNNPFFQNLFNTKSP